MKIYEVVFKKISFEGDTVPTNQVHYWSGANVSHVAQMAADYATDYEPLKDGASLELVTVKYILTVKSIR